MTLQDRVKKTIEEHCLVPAGSIVLLGLSGGPDSLALLHVLASLRKELSFELHALHLNHLMRGEDADADVLFLKNECRALDVPLTVRTCDVCAKACREAISTEEAGRAARHDALKEEAEALRSRGSDVRIAFAHNQNDQAETVLLRILRGTGVHGLAAMEYLRRDGVIRPLLDASRPEIEAYCAENGLAPRFDSTNASEEYMRNRLRLRLLPLLEDEYNPNLKEGLVRLAANAREDDECLALIAEEKLALVMTEEPDGSLRLSYKALSAMPPALFKRVVTGGFSRIGLAKDIASSHLNSLYAAVSLGRFGKIIQFPQGYYARVLARGVFLGWSDKAFIKEKKK